MEYDLNELSNRIKQRRKALLLRVSILGAIMIVMAVLSIINFNETVTFLCIVLQFPSFYSIVKVFNKLHGKIIFSRELIGENIKENEYGIQNDGQPPIFRWVNTPNTYSNRKVHPRRLNGSVYIKLKDGNIKEIRGLYKSHMDIYEEGDILMKPAGVQFPIVINRKVAEQPCPDCGEINSAAEEMCSNCGLKILSYKGVNDN